MTKPQQSIEDVQTAIRVVEARLMSPNLYALPPDLVAQLPVIRHCLQELLSIKSNDHVENYRRSIEASVDAEIWKSVAERIAKEFGLVEIHSPHKLEQEVLHGIEKLRERIHEFLAQPFKDCSPLGR